MTHTALNTAMLANYLQNAQDAFFKKPLYDRNAVLSAPSLETYLQDLRTEAARLKDEPLCELPFHTFKQYDTTGNRLSYENVYFHRRRCLGIFTLMAWLYQDDDYLSLTEDYLWAICNEFTWALPAHLDGNSLNDKVNPLTLDLFACETAQTLAEITYLLKERLNPAVTLRCQSEVEHRIFTPFLARTTPYWWETCHMNWASVCAGSIGMAAILQMTDTSDNTQRLAKLLSQLLPVMEYFLSGFENDGACLEGLSYWTYGMSYFTAFSDLLAIRTNGKLDLLANDKVKAVAAFQGKCYLEGGHTVSFSDADANDTFRIGITNYLAHYFNHDIPLPPAASAARFGTDACARWCQMFRDFVWTATAQTAISCTGASEQAVAQAATATVVSPVTQAVAQTVSSAPLSRSSACVLPDAKWLIFRDVYANAGAIKGGHNDEPHNHNDVGSFFFLLHGSEVLTDLGAGEYVKDSFSDKRYTIFTNNSFSHSVPIINGNGQKTGREYSACEYLFTNGGVNLSSMDCSGSTGTESRVNSACSTISASMDIAPAYGDESLSSLIRTLTFDSTAHTLTLCDSYTFTEAPVSLAERFVTRQKPALAEDFVTLYSENGESCHLSFDADRLSASISTDIHYRHSDGAPETVYLLDFTLKQADAAPILKFVLSWN